MKLYSLKDRLASEFAPPFSAKNVDVANRMVRQLLLQHPNIAPTEFELYEVGEFFEDTGLMDKPLSPILVSSSMSLASMPFPTREQENER
nr:MAG: hypothetical protein [Microviridae sp.]